MNTAALTQEDLRFVVTRIPKDVRAMMVDTGMMLGGGFIRETIAQEKPNDLDFFGPNKDVMLMAAKLLAEKRKGRFFQTENAITVLTPIRAPIQFITRWLAHRAEQVLLSFDFTVCQAVVWYNRDEKKWESLAAATFYSDLAARRLVYTHPVREEAVGGSLMRVRKFLARGYNIQARSLAGVVARLALAVRFDETPGSNTDEQVITKVITGLLHEVDPLIVLDGLEPIDEHATLDGALPRDRYPMQELGNFTDSAPIPTPPKDHY